MKPIREREELLRDVLSGAVPENFREESLERCLALAGRKRRSRRAWRLVWCAALPLLIGAGAFLGWPARKGESTFTAAPAVAAAPSRMVPGTSIELIDDQQLLEFFQGRPVALIGPPDRRQLVLLDEVIN